MEEKKLQGDESHGLSPGWGGQRCSRRPEGTQMLPGCSAGDSGAGGMGPVAHGPPRPVRVLIWA